MTITRRQLLVGSSAGLLTFAIHPRAWASTALALVVGPSTNLESVSRAELKRLFLGETDNIGGAVLVPFNMAASLPDRAIFLEKVLGMTTDQETKYWIDRRIRGQRGAPKSAPSIEVLLKVAAKFPKAITYVPASSVGADVKVLRVDGKLPTDGGYSLLG